MDYTDKKKASYREKENSAEYYVKIEKSEKEGGQNLPNIREIVEDLPLSGSIVSVPDFHDNTIFFTSLDTHAYAADANTGDMKWKFKTGAQIVSSPLVHRNRVYFGSFDCHLYCLDLDGSLIWKKHLGDFVFSPVTAIGDRIFVGNGQGTFFCLSPEGEELWRFKTGDCIVAFPAPVNGLVIVSSYDKSVYAFDGEGRLKWRFITGERVSAPIIMSRGKTVFSGTRRSREKMPSANEPLIYCGSYDNHLYCLSETGEALWKFNCGSSIPGGIGGNNGSVYAGTVSGRIFSIDAFDGSKNWDFLCGGMISGGGEVSKKKVYFGSFDQRVYCLSEKGEKLWDFLTGGPVVFRPLIIGNKIYFGSVDTFLYCLNTKERSVEWTFQAGFGLPDAAKALATSLTNRLVEYDRKVFKVWKPETTKISKGDITALQGYSGSRIPEGFEFGGMTSYSAKTPYISKSKYLSRKGPYTK